MLVNVKTLAEWYGVNLRTVTNWVNEVPPCPSVLQGGRRLFDPVAVHRWHLERAVRQAEARRTREAARAGAADYDRARARRMAALARLAEMQAARTARELIPVEELEAVVGEITDRLRAVLINLPGTYALHLERAGLAPERAQAVLEDVAQELVRALRGVAEEIEAREDVEDAAGEGSGEA